MSKNSISLKIKGMSCASCSTAIEKALNKESSVKTAKVNFPMEKAYVEYDSDKIDADKIQKIVKETGYDIADEDSKEVKIKITGMTCASCSAAVEKSLKKAKGVKKANVNLASEIATIKIKGTETNYNDLKSVVENTGYGVAEVREDKQNEQEMEKYKKAKNRMIAIWAVTIPIMLWMIPEMFFGIAWPNELVYKLGMIILASVGLFTVGLKTYTSAFNSLIHGSANMDVLIMLGTGAALLTGFLNFFIEVASFAGIAAMIMAFHLTGRYIEAKAKGKASQAIRKLLELGAKTAVVERNDTEEEIPVSDLKIGDIMIVKAGAKIPTDGTVIEGKSTVDESMATGESVPVKKKKNDKVLGATINQNGLIKVKAEKIGKDTFLSQVIKMVEEAQGSKVPIQEFADKVTAIFVPIVIALAVLTFLSWITFPSFFQNLSQWAAQFVTWINPEANVLTQAVFATVAVLVIACPCALGLATPTALMVGSGIGAKNGILIRNGAAIQTMKDIKVILFDKTGTITKGKPEVTDLVALEDDKELIKLTASLEKKSDHPLANAILKYAKKENIELEKVTEVETVSGKGIIGKNKDKKIILGNQKLMKEYNLDYSKMKNKIHTLENEAKTVVLAGTENKFLGIIAIADAIKPGSQKAIQSLHQLGFKTGIITGDNQKTAQAIADRVGIDYVVAEILPDQKVKQIRNFQNKYGLTAMVGDGINDAPALKQANVGIAIGSGTDIAIESADITIVKGNINSVVKGVKLSQKTFRKIKQNLFWAFGYNLIAIPLAIMGILHPVIAEIAMATSSVTVVTNANLLKRIKL